MKTKLFIVQEVDRVAGHSKLVGVYSFIEDAIDLIAKLNSSFQHSKFEIYESVLGSGKVQLVDAKVKYDTSPEVI